MPKSRPEFDPAREDLAPHVVVTYRLRADDETEARRWAHTVAREQTIECIDEGVPHRWILDEVLGEVMSVEPTGDATHFDARIAYGGDTFGDELPQLLNVVFGNSSMHTGVRLVDLELTESVRARFPGPRFGIEGVRLLTGRVNGPMTCAVLKPMGLSPDELAELAYRCALGGVDIVKDDHGLANQRWAPFRERVERIAAAIERANRETGGHTLYAPSLNAPFDEFRSRAEFAKGAGATAFLVMPGLTGFDSVRWLAGNEALSLPILMHPSALGCLANSPENGYSHSTFYALYPRLIGADVSIYPSFGGRYGFSRELCRQVAHDCLDSRGPYRPILPSPGGGMSLELAATIHGLYGDDALYLFGGALMRYGKRIDDGIREIRAALVS